MSHPSASNGGFRYQEVTRKKFQQTAASVIDGHAETLKNHDARLTIVTDGLINLTETVTHNANTLRVIGGRTPSDASTFYGRLRWLFTGQ